MSKSFSGGCACGAIRYDIAAESVAMLDCQCRHCQQESGTGHASHLVFPRAAAELRGNATQWSIEGEQGSVKTRAFCPTCGSPVSMTTSAAPDVIVIRAASLDEPQRYSPQAVLWTKSAQPWDRIDPTLPTFEKMPPG